MRKILMLTCGVLMISSVVIAEEETVDTTCAGGAGTILMGKSGYKYCMSKNQMNWWNAVAWCDGLKDKSGATKRLFDLKRDCACSETTANCASKTCSELAGVSSSSVWTVTPASGDVAYRVDLSSGTIYNHYAGRSYYHYSLCK